MNGHRTTGGNGLEATHPASLEGGQPNVSRAGLVLLYARNFEQFRPAYLLRAPCVVIGRDASADVVVPEQAVSRQHARIAYEEGRWVLRDLGSRNGTMLDGAYVSDDVELEQGHEIRVGDACFKFVADGADRYAAFHIDGRILGERRARMITELVGGAQMDGIAAELERVAPTLLSCVILGESGTGKEIAARELHRVSRRRGSLQAVNCAAIPQTLLESELFGYRRGAFSGADRDKPGLVKLADAGTLFLDEIGDMPLDAQAKLLRVLQSREVFPLGAVAPERVDVRLVCATHRDLRQSVAEGRFRGDLYARISEHCVVLPPLRDRKEDIYRLACLFCARYARRQLSLAFSFVVALLHHDWPFNVRELESCIKRAVALADGDVIDVGQLPDSIAQRMREYGARAAQPARDMRPSTVPPAAPVDRKPGRIPSEQELRALLARHCGNVAAVGRELGKERMQVHRWMKRYGVSVEEYRRR
jgi:transcriptional regulator with PAS, ATPase and Fis domain